jgi:hypothetical protein
MSLANRFYSWYKWKHDHNFWIPSWGGDAINTKMHYVQKPQRSGKPLSWNSSFWLVELHFLDTMPPTQTKIQGPKGSTSMQMYKTTEGKTHVQKMWYSEICISVFREISQTPEQFLNGKFVKVLYNAHKPTWKNKSHWEYFYAPQNLTHQRIKSNNYRSWRQAA